MDNKKNITYTNCYWHANGEMKCKQVTVPYNPNQSQQNVEFDNFSTPNSNYKPNEYRQHFSYYEQPAPQMCGANCSCDKKEIDNQWMSPSRDYHRKEYLKNNN